MHYESKPSIILGSSSTARKKVLSRLKIPFTTMSPDIPEVRGENETPSDFTLRLAIEKAKAIVKKTNANSIILSGDQILVCDNKIFGKPHTEEKAIEQLEFFSGKTAKFITSICLLRTSDREKQTLTTETIIKFKPLSDETIRKYINIESPLKCAGSFKAEGLGISLIEEIKSDDPYAILGVPLMHLCIMLKKFNFDVI
jgi:MAF protein